MADDEINQDLSLEAPEDEDMDFDASLPVETSDNLKPLVITTDSAQADSTESKLKVLASDEDMIKLRGLFDVPVDVNRKLSNATI